MNWGRLAYRIALPTALILTLLAVFFLLVSPWDGWIKFIFIVLPGALWALFVSGLLQAWRPVMLGAIILGALTAILLVNAEPLLVAVVSVGNGLLNPDTFIDRSRVIMCADSDGCRIIHPIVFSIIFLVVIITGFAYATLLERKLIARLQHRSGPNRVGPAGLLQPLADGIKLIFKEDIRPATANQVVYLIAPLLKVIPTLILIAVIPLGPDIIVPWFGGDWYQIPLGLADVNVGILWILAITSVGTYGVVLAGWSSNNKYAMLGGLRASAQMISYELSLGLTMAVPVMIVGSMSMGDIINAQRNVWEWFVFQNPLAAVILMIALIAEVNRAPFDLPEAEQELTAGFMTEYSGMKFATFMMAEYLGMIGVSVVAVSLFFGGYHLLPVDTLPILGPVNMILKVVVFLMGFVWLRATLPRIRYDRLMAFGWKVMLPLALLAVAWTAVSLVIGDQSGGNPLVYGLVSGILLVIAGIAGYGLLVRGRSDAEPEPALENDPMITGDRRSIGWVLINLIGGLIAVPFSLYNITVRAFQTGKDVGGAAAGTAVDSSAIVPADAKTPAKRAAGGD